MDNMKYLRMASNYAHIASGCTKVKVGSVISSPMGLVVSFGANRTFPNTCKALGCNRVRLYGDNSKDHRLPSDCNAIHSEIDAIAKMGEVDNAIIFITRYPCEACARAIVAAGIKTVVYGREQEISDITKEIFSENAVNVIWEKNWKEEDVTH
jgi:dCMP deaminase